MRDISTTTESSFLVQKKLDILRIIENQDIIISVIIGIDYSVGIDFSL